MGRGKIEKLGLKTIADAVRGSDVLTARCSLVADCWRGRGRFGKCSKASVKGRTMQVGD